MECEQSIFVKQEQQPIIDGAENNVCDSNCCRLFNVKKYQRRKVRLQPNARCAVKSVLVLLLICFGVFLFTIYHRNSTAIVPGWEPNITRDIGHYIRPSQNTSSIDPHGVCDDMRPILLLIVVCSAANNFERRQAIRETWGNTIEFNYSKFQYIHKQFDGLYLNINYWEWSDRLRIDPYLTNELNEAGNSSYAQNFLVKILFLVGQTPSMDTQLRITEESDIKNDLIQEGFLDTYNNLTLKSVMMLKWVKNHCVDKVKFVMKSDDDTFVNVPNMIHVLLGGTVPVYEATLEKHDSFSVMAQSPSNRLMMTHDLLIGSRFCHPRPIRDVSSKWFTPEYLFDRDIYPNFLSGTGYVMSVDVAVKLYEAALSTPVLHLEDVYLTGICAKAVNITPRNHQLFNSKSCDDYCELRGMLTKHEFSAKQLRSAYQFVLNANISCPLPNSYAAAEFQMCY